MDQLLRATASIPLNIAEGAGERSSGRRAYFYRVAHASATEIGAALDHMVDMELLRASDTAQAKQLTVRVVAMLFRLTDRVAAESSSKPISRPNRKPPVQT